MKRLVVAAVNLSRGLLARARSRALRVMNMVLSARPGEIATLWRYWPALRRSRQSRVTHTAGKRVVMLVVSNLRVDPRVERAARCLAEAGYRVTVIWPDAYEPSHQQQPLCWGDGIEFRPLPAHASGYIFSFPWVCGSKMLEAAARERPFAIHCHDLNTALIGLAAARGTGALCVCDFHEWYSENVSWDDSKSGWGPHPPLKRFIYRLTERLVLARADAVITVCESIARELSDQFSDGQRTVHVIRNIPPLAPPSGRYGSLRTQLGIAKGKFLLLWQGGTGPSRLIEPIIRSLQLAPDVVFVIRGPSLEHYGDGYRELARDVGVGDRLILLPPVPSSDVVDAAVGADAGIWTLPNISKNFYFALPNKIFEYLAAGLPVLAANFPEARKLVEGLGVGLCFDPYQPQSIAQQLNRLSGDAAYLAAIRDRIPAAMAEINAGNEWRRLVELYARLCMGETV